MAETLLIPIFDPSKDIVIGTHNSMTYGSVTNWFISAASKIFAKCQSKTVDKQIQFYGALDLRIYFDCKDNVGYEEAKNHIRYSHGKAKYQSTQTWEQFFNILTAMSGRLQILPTPSAGKVCTTPGIVRLILEHADSSTKENWFKQLCEEIQQKYPTILFTGGYKKDGWVSLYDFNKNRPTTGIKVVTDEGVGLLSQTGIVVTEANIHQWVSSMMPDAKWYEKVCPQKYATRMNQTNFKKIKAGINLFDFL